MSTIIIIGASGTGKSTLENYLCNYYGYRKIVSYTTRKPRDGEVNGKDYWFINEGTFKEMVKEGLFAEYEEYSQNRFYGTLKSDYVDGDNVVVLTPNGFRQLQRSIQQMNNIITVLVRSKLGTRIKRYIDRIGVDKFSYEDKNEICSRTDRDWGMFLGLESQVDIILDNDENNSIDNFINDFVERILSYEKN